MVVGSGTAEAAPPAEAAEHEPQSDAAASSMETPAAAPSITAPTPALAAALAADGAPYVDAVQVAIAADDHCYRIDFVRCARASFAWSGQWLTCARLSVCLSVWV
jgi:hypothetical protein